MRADYPSLDMLDDLRGLWKEAFGDSDSFLDNFFDTAYAPDRCQCICIDGRPVSALYWLDCRCDGAPMAYIYAVATLKKHRGQGLCRTLMENTHAHLKNLGYAGCILVPGKPELFAMYAQMGYACFGGMDTLHCSAAAETALRELDPEEYGALRKNYLPQRGVLQEGLNFLSSYAKLYAGGDFICAWADGLGLELLGNPAVGPGILGALGVESGSFRVPGNAPFAMYHPLSDTAAPGYFGIAFD